MISISLRERWDPLQNQAKLYIAALLCHLSNGKEKTVLSRRRKQSMKETRRHCCASSVSIVRWYGCIYSATIRPSIEKAHLVCSRV